MHTIWKGAISFGLVNVPVKMFTATQDNDISLRMLHKVYNVPIQYKRTCPKCETDVSWDDIVKGYEYEPGHFVTFDKNELKQLESESSRQISILDFVDLDEIDPIYYQKTYYLAPEETGKHAYRLLVRALEESNKVGIANVTIRSKSSLAAIRVVNGVLSMVTMFYAEEVRAVEELPNRPQDIKVNDKELEMAKMLIDQLTGKFEPNKYEDEFKEKLLEAIDRKVEGKEVKVAPEVKQTNVIDLMDALKASLNQTKSSTPDKKEKPAKSKKTTTGAKKKSQPKSKKDENEKTKAARPKTSRPNRTGS